MTMTTNTTGLDYTADKVTTSNGYRAALISTSEMKRQVTGTQETSTVTKSYASGHDTVDLVVIGVLSFSVLFLIVGIIIQSLVYRSNRKQSHDKADAKPVSSNVLSKGNDGSGHLEGMRVQGAFEFEEHEADDGKLAAIHVTNLDDDSDLADCGYGSLNHLPPPSPQTTMAMSCQHDDRKKRCHGGAQQQHVLGAASLLERCSGKREATADQGKTRLHQASKKMPADFLHQQSQDSAPTHKTKQSVCSLLLRTGLFGKRKSQPAAEPTETNQAERTGARKAPDLQIDIEKVTSLDQVLLILSRQDISDRYLGNSSSGASPVSAAKMSTNVYFFPGSTNRDRSNHAHVAPSASLDSVGDQIPKIGKQQPMTDEQRYICIATGLPGESHL